MSGRRQFFSLNSKDTPEYNIALLGALGVGKSALTVKYLTKRFIMEYDPTLEDTYTRLDTIDGHDVTIHIMDTYDLEGSQAERYLKWAHAFVVVYSITNRASFDSAKRYLESIIQHQRITGRDRPIFLVGNKMDLERYRTVTKVAGKTLSTEFDCSCYETSAAEDYDSVETVFQDAVRDIHRSNEQHLPLQPLFISEPGLQGRNALRRVKSPKSQDAKDKERKDDKVMQRRTPSTFKLFNKSFKIFN